jgi:hypothetical protein
MWHVAVRYGDVSAHIPQPGEMVVDPRSGFRPQAPIVDLVRQVMGEIVPQFAHFGPGFYAIANVKSGTVPMHRFAGTYPQPLQAQASSGIGVMVASICEDSLDPCQSVEQGARVIVRATHSGSAPGSFATAAAV